MSKSEQYKTSYKFQIRSYDELSTKQGEYLVCSKEASRKKVHKFQKEQYLNVQNKMHKQASLNKGYMLSKKPSNV